MKVSGSASILMQSFKAHAGMLDGTGGDVGRMGLLQLRLLRTF